VPSGNLIVIVGTSLALIGLTCGGVRYPWNSAEVLSTLIIGLCLIGFFIFYESKWSKVPTIPFDVMSNRTSFAGYASASQKHTSF
jgi:Fungal trichothecene efflux pump (TRI12)